jgi:hypothetical protein
LCKEHLAALDPGPSTPIYVLAEALEEITVGEGPCQGCGNVTTDKCISCLGFIHEFCKCKWYFSSSFFLHPFTVYSSKKRTLPPSPEAPTSKKGKKYIAIPVEEPQEDEEEETEKTFWNSKMNAIMRKRNGTMKDIRFLFVEEDHAGLLTREALETPGLEVICFVCSNATSFIARSEMVTLSFLGYLTIPLSGTAFVLLATNTCSPETKIKASDFLKDLRGNFFFKSTFVNRF